MKECMPEAYKELVENCEILERHYKDMMVNLWHYTGLKHSYLACLFVYLPIFRLVKYFIRLQ